MKGRDLLSITDLSPDELDYLIRLALSMKRDGTPQVLAGKTIAMLFEKPSLRTRVSFEVGMKQLGGTSIYLSQAEVGLGQRESIEDVAHVLDRYVSALVVRTYSQQGLVDLAAAASIPVVNALSDDEHPCQALADLLTMREVFGRLDGLRLAYIGDSDNVARSLMEAGALSGVEVVVASPPAYQAEEVERRQVLEFVAAHHGHVGIVSDPYEAVAGAHAVYTDVWVSMGAEADAERRMRELAAYQVTPELMAAAEPGAVFMHCLPAHRGEEVVADVIDGPQSVVWRQAGNRLPTEQAIVYALITGDWGGHER
jgi:ornithine carbamoyltransferase